MQYAVIDRINGRLVMSYAPIEASSIDDARFKFLALFGDLREDIQALLDELLLDIVLCNRNHTEAYRSLSLLVAKSAVNEEKNQCLLDLKGLKE